MLKKPSYEELEQKVQDFEALESLPEGSDMMLQRLFDLSIDMLCVADIGDGCFKYINKSFEKTLGYTKEELLKEPFINFVHSDDRSSTISAVENLSKGEPVINFDNRYRCKDGSYKWLAWTSMPVPSQGLTYAVARNITERKQAEEALQESEERYRMLLDSVPDPVVIIGDEFQILSFNSTFTELLGYSQQDLGKGLSPLDLVEGVEKRISSKRMERRFAGEKVVPESHTVGLRSKDGKTIPCEVKGTLIQYNGQPADLVIIRDIRERKRSEDLIHTLTHKLIKSQENERQRISRELHDSVAQDLSVARIDCGMLLDNELEEPSKVKQKISQISETLYTSIMAVRDLSYDLRPPGLNELGLVQALQQYFEDFFEKTGVIVDFKSAGMNRLRLNFNTKINLYRIVQEGLNNVKKHADAHNVSIKLVSALPNIILRIEDDGKGFNVMERLTASSDEKRMGLQSMKERVSLLQGRIDIQSSHKKGTNIVIEIPYVV